MGIELECIAIEKSDDTSVILGHAGFIKTVEDLYEAMVGSVPGVKFGILSQRLAGLASQGVMETTMRCEHRQKAAFSKSARATRS